MISQLVKEHSYLCYYVGLLLVFLSCLKVWLLWCKKNKCSTSDGIPPGNRGLPFIGETLHFMAAINSTKGVYEFVRVRRVR
jgi:cytochrome P450 family 26 subfamily A